MNKGEYKRELEYAAENVANHTVELVSGVGKYGTNEIWRCTNNGSSMYGFDLVISRFGIAMYGDVDSLVFSVGSQYGIDFLVRDSVCSYMISKLEPEYRNKRELDEDRLRKVLLEAGCRLLEEEFIPYVPDGEDDYNGLPEWLGSANSADQTWENLIDELQKHAPEQPHMKFEEFCDNAELLLDARAYDGLQAVESFLAENCNELYLGPEWYEHTISRHDGGLIQKLEMLRLCAIKIKTVKEVGDGLEQHS